MHQMEGIYAPLSQVMTDSDSEEEIHNSSQHSQQQYFQQQQGLRNKENIRNPPKTLPLNHFHQPQFPLPQPKFQAENFQSDNQRQPSSYTNNMRNTFRSVMMSDGISLGLNGDGTHCYDPSTFSSINNDYDDRSTEADNVAILGNLSKEMDNKTMSAARRGCFYCSLFICILPVIAFLWLVPCGEDSACPAALDRVKTHNWYNNYSKIELKGGINVVNGLRNWEKNLIFLYRGDTFFHEFRSNNPKRNGIISLIGSSGVVAWYDEMVDEPVAIDCTILDVDGNGEPDCLVVDEYGELGAINPISGQWQWRFKERSVHKVDALDFPVMLPDLDGDGVLEILTVTSAKLETRTKNYVRKGDIKKEDKKDSERNILHILSGRLGKPIGEGFRIRDCEVLRKLQLENRMITFNCLRNNTEVQRYKTLAELYALITNKSIVNHKLKPTGEISQHRHYGQRKDIDAQRNIYSLSGRELVVENRGKCPDDCNVTLILCETRDGKTKVLRNFTNSGMYGMVPTQWHFKNTQMSGFVMKVWKWNHISDVHEEKEKKSTTNATADPADIGNKKLKPNSMKDKSTNHNQVNANKTKRSRRKRSAHDLEHEFSTSEFNAFDSLVKKRSQYEIPNRIRLARSVTNATMKQQDQTQVDKYKMQMKMITETVILVLFMGDDTRIENTSQSNITQFCRTEGSEEICQPDLNNQENSMLIADLDQDGSQELVSYMSTFVRSPDDTNNWRLLTYVRLLRLQSELPTLYAEDKHN